MSDGDLTPKERGDEFQLPFYLSPRPRHLLSNTMTNGNAGQLHRHHLDCSATRKTD